MKLNRISLPLTEDGSGWGQIAQNYVRKALTGDWEQPGSCALLSIQTTDKGACEAQTTEEEYYDNLKKSKPNQANALLKAMLRKVQNQETIPLPMKSTGVQYTAEELKKTFNPKAGGRETCGRCMFYIEPEQQ